MCNSKKPYLVRCSTCTTRKGYLAYISGYFFSLIMTMHDMPLYALKKNIHRSWKAKRIKMLLNMVASMFIGDVRVIWCTLKVMVPIKQLWLCVDIFDSLISLSSYDETLMLSCKSFTHNMNTLYYFWYIV